MIEHGIIEQALSRIKEVKDLVAEHNIQRSILNKIRIH